MNAIDDRRRFTPWIVVSGLSFLLASLGLVAAHRLAPARMPALPGAIAGEADQPGVQWRTLDDLPRPVAQFPSVFWEPRDTDSLRARVRGAAEVRGRQVLEVGTGTGLIALYCLLAGAERVVATDVNPAAVANARYNAKRFHVAERLETRLVPQSHSLAFAVIGADEQFDLIVSNPPWENDRPRTMADYALYDPGFRLLESFLADGAQHLRPGGKLWLAYGCVEAIRLIEQMGPQYGWQVQSLDDRNLAELPPVFLPGWLLELTPAPGRTQPVRRRNRAEPNSPTARGPAIAPRS